jgi:hypothetical protein
MKNKRNRGWTKYRVAMALMGTLLAGGVQAAHLVQQTIPLQPGWNAVYLEVEPVSNATVDVFRDIPIASAWGWRPRGPSSEFVENLTEQMFRDPQWLCFFPTNRTERMFNNLFRVTVNQPYFIKLEGATPVNWVVTGRPAVRTFAYAPNEFNLVGYPLRTSGSLPGRASFFSHDPALAGQAIYALNPTGSWALVTDGDQPMEAGKCLWVYAATASSYLGPVNVSVEIGDGLDFGKTLTEAKVFIQNRTAAPTVIRIRDLGGAGPIAYWSFNNAQNVPEWLPIPDPLTIPLAAGETHTVRISVLRDQFTDTMHETTLEVESDSGTRVRIPLSARLP